MKISMEELCVHLPGPVSEKWPEGERFVLGLAHGTMRTEYYAPRGNDPQTPHEQDELYFIMQGSGEFVLAEQRYSCRAGDAFFVRAGLPHRFENFSDDFGSWVVFWGPKGGES